MASAKQEFLAYAEENGVQIDHEVSYRGSHHLTAYAPEWQQFSGNRCECLALWDGEKGNPPDWKACLADLQNHMPLERFGAELGE